jgi:hypothetical protein
MISRRNVLERCSTHELDSLIRWMLREEVAGASPPSRVWERIRACIKRPTARERLECNKGYQILMAQLFSVKVFISTQISHLMRPQNVWVDWRANPPLAYLFVDHGGLQLLLAL